MVFCNVNHSLKVFTIVREQIMIFPHQVWKLINFFKLYLLSQNIQNVYTCLYNYYPRDGALVDIIIYK